MNILSCARRNGGLKANEEWPARLMEEYHTEDMDGFRRTHSYENKGTDCLWIGSKVKASRKLVYSKTGSTASLIKS